MFGWPALTILLAFLPQTASAPGSQTASVTIHLVANPLVDLHFFVRSAGEVAPNAPDWLKPAIRAAAECEIQLGGASNWPILEAQLSEFDTAEAFTAFARRLPEEMATRRGDSIRLRAAAVPYAEALTAVEPKFLGEIWPKDRAAIEKARESWVKLVGAKESACLSDIAQAFGLHAKSLLIPVVLVAHAPRPHAVTMRRRGGPECFVSCTEFQGTQFVEAVMHEATHAMEAAADDPNQVLNQLRERLKSVDSKVLRDLPHTLMFAQAAATVGRMIDPNHIPYGDSSGYYDRVGPLGKRVAAVWNAHLRGEKSLSETLDELTELGRAATSTAASAPTSGIAKPEP